MPQLVPIWLILIFKGQFHKTQLKWDLISIRSEYYKEYINSTDKKNLINDGAILQCALVVVYPATEN